MEITAPPCSVEWFQKRLDEACLDHNLELRIVWPPSLVVARIVRDKQVRVYKKYPLIKEGEFNSYVKGHYFYRRSEKSSRLRVVGYQPIGKLVPQNIRPTDLVEPDIEQVNHSIHIWVFEKKRPDEEARREHAIKRRLAMRELGIDIFGDFPPEGVWDWWEDISIHENGCCEMAQPEGIRCRGLYREPNEEDLENVRRAIQVRQALPAKDVDAQIEQASRDIRDGIIDWEKKQRAEARYRARTIGITAQRSLEKPAVYKDPAKDRFLQEDSNARNS